MRLPTANPLRAALLGAMLCALALLGACGGGASGGSDGTKTVANLPPSVAKPTDANVAVVTVESGPRNNVNIPYVTVTLCIPGSTTCKNIDHVLLDTGSTGLRVFSSVLSSAGLNLPPHTIGSSSSISECAQFLNAMAWGGVKVADVSIGSKTARNVPVQVMDTTQAPTAYCGSAPLMAPPSYSSNASFSPLSANGILGISQFTYDGQTYFNCTNPVTTPCKFTPSSSQQVQNPVALFSSDNNGVVLQMPAVSATGATSAQGYLIFGVGTQANNLLGDAHIVPLNSQGYFSTIYKGRTLTNSFMDSGSNGLFFDDATISSSCSTSAAGFYCPATVQPLSAGIVLGSTTTTVNFSIANANALLAGSNYVFNNLGGTIGSSNMFDWGLPFFFGRSVYTVLEGKSVGSATGPFYAFTN